VVLKVETGGLLKAPLIVSGGIMEICRNKSCEYWKDSESNGCLWTHCITEKCKFGDKWQEEPKKYQVREGVDYYLCTDCGKDCPCITAVIGGGMNTKVCLDGDKVARFEKVTRLEFFQSFLKSE
jgi:hypothetical protein